jgi:hypothetical protein
MRNGMPASSKRASNFAASRGAYLPSGTNSVSAGSSDFMRRWDTSNEIEISYGRASWQTHWAHNVMGTLAESSLIGVWLVAKLNRASCYKSNLMKKPIYSVYSTFECLSSIG